MTVNVAAVFILVAGVVALAIAIGPRAVRWLADNWQAILLPAGCVLVGAGLVLLVSRSGTAPLRAIDPPREDGGNPLQELKSLAERTADRLRGAYRFELLSTLVVGAIFAGLVVWSLVMVSQQRLLYASAFGSGSVAMAVLSRWKWQPFDRINQARRLADNADTLATGLRLRMATIAEIPEPRERARAQWEAVEEYLARS